MHTPRPFGLAAYGGQLTADDLAFIDHIAKQLTNVKDTSKLQSLKWVYDLPDGGEVVIYDMGGVFRAIATKPSEQDEPPQHDYMAHSHIPMLFSGAITKSIVGSDEGVGLQVTEWTRKRIGEYRDAHKPNKTLEMQRFVVDYPPHLKEFEPNPPPRNKHTQYAKARPTWYSGSMAKVVQIVGGYGRQDLKELPDKYWEQAQVRLPDKVKRAVDDTLKDKLLPAYTGYPPKDGQLQYDYKHRHTNAVAFDDQNKPWLLSISAKGVYAMPLPLIPATTTTAYREWIESVGDSEILSILDTFGGLPSGESFPKKSDDFHTWERAGVIIKVCDTADFYTHLAYSTAMGWSFNMFGTDGYNTCYNYNQDGLIVGYTYNMTLKLVSVSDNANLSDNKKTLDDHKAKELAVYLSKIFQKIDRTTAKGGAIVYKIRRLSDKELYKRMDMSVDDWDNLTLEPIAKHTGQVRKVYEGMLYHPAKALGQPQIKFAEPIVGGCISFDFSVAEGYPKPKNPPKCDTIMFAYFADDNLKVVKYYYDDTKFYQKEDTNFEEIMIVGDWYKTIYNGWSGIFGNFYHSDIDDRTQLSDSIVHTTIKGKDLGYGNPAFITPAIFDMWGSLSRSRYYSHTIEKKTTSNPSINIAVCIPFLNRNAALYVRGTSSSSNSIEQEAQLRSVGDPRSYSIWTYDPIWHFRGGAGIGRPSPKTGDIVYVNYRPSHDYHYNDYSSFAESGDWFGVAEGSYKDVSGLLAKYTSRKSGQKHTGGVVIGGEAPYFEEYQKKQRKDAQSNYIIYFLDSIPITVHNNTPDSWYFSRSPMITGNSINYFYRDSCTNLMGDTVYANVSETVNGKRKYWGNSQFVNSIGHDTAHHFIGAINE